MRIVVVFFLATIALLITLANAQPGSPLRGGTGCSVEGTENGEWRLDHVSPGQHTNYSRALGRRHWTNR